MRLVFTGAMDYWANVDAVVWFVNEVWPLVRARHPDASFAIVGSKPTAEVQVLAAHAGVVVTGRVPDVRPWLAGASIVVAPLRIARGVQNKVLEAMSMARPVVATGAACRRTLAVLTCQNCCALDAPSEFVAAIELLLGRALSASPGNRQFVLDQFGWAAALQPLWPLLEWAG